LLSPAEPVAEQQRIGFWLDGFSQFAHSAVNDYKGFNSVMAGGCAGIDYAFTDRFVAGVGAGFANTNLNFDANWGQSNFQSYSASVYGTYFTEKIYVEGVLSYGKHKYHDRHFIDLGSSQLNSSSSHDGDTFSSVLEGGYTFRPKGFVIQPFAGLSYSYLAEGKVQENGAGALGLIVKDRQANTLSSEVGMRLARPVKVPQGSLVPQVSAAWKYDFQIDKLSVPAAFTARPDVGFVLNSREIGGNRAVLGAEIAFVNKKGVSASLRYDADLGKNFTSQGVSGQVRISF
jgi:outer membrane autotransporter protein